MLSDIRRVCLKRGEQVIPIALAATMPVSEECAETALGVQERLYWAQLPTAKRRHSFLAGRYAAKSALAVLTGIAPLSSIEIAQGAFGQPVVNSASPCAVDVSISHCAGATVAVAFPSGHPIGIDVERASDVTEARVENHFQFSECRLACRAKFSQPDAHAVLWTAKEALSKVLRCGLTVPLDLLLVMSIEPIGDQCFELMFGNFSQYRCMSWIIGNFAVAMVVPRKTEVPSLTEFWQRALDSPC